jgi:conjugative relaxase-like TrwC/TraI family protein
MTLHKLTAGSGYEYLTRQVAALDATDKGHTGLADYYEAKGEAPGQWVGSGLAGVTGLGAGDPVTADQMLNLFGLGLHPLADDLEAQHDARMDAEGRRGDARERRRAGWLGKPYAVHVNDVTPLQIEVARRATAAQKANDGMPVSPDVRAQIRTAVAREFFTHDHGRKPATERELAGYLAQQTRPKTTAVAGYDLTFSPVKSVSALWAVTDPHTAKMIEHAHSFAVTDALKFIEDHALYTRTGAGGVRQIKTTGLVATAFTHRDSRAGDPDLHTHVAVANKVQGIETDEHGNQIPGRWLAIDGRVLFKANVAASETYNTRLEHHLTKALGVRFADRIPPAGAHLRGAKRPVREIIGIDPTLLTRWSTRRRQVVDAQTDLAAQFRADHGRPPTPVEALHLAQQANLQIRQAKHSGRSEAEQRDTWHTQAVETLSGDPDQVQAMVDRALTPPPAKNVRAVDQAWVEATAATMISELEQRRATWQTWHIHAEAERQIRAAGVIVKDPAALTHHLVDVALSTHSVSLAGPAEADFDITPHPALRRDDGASVYTVHGSERFTSARILAAEHRVLAHCAETGAPVVPDQHGRLAVLEAAANGTPLNRGQAALVQTWPPPDDASSSPSPPPEPARPPLYALLPPPGPTPAETSWPSHPLPPQPAPSTMRSGP